jgi:tetratricopeptide (TPR) repeat protein
MIQIDLTSSRSRSLFLGFISLLAGILGYSAIKVSLAAHWDSSSKPELWLRAAALEPDKPSYWEHVGLYKQWNLVNSNERQAILYLERATQINPLSDKLCMELASAYENVGDTFRARQAYENAERAHPSSSDVARRYGSFLLRQGDFPLAFGEIRRALVNNPSLTANAISECWKADPNVDAILDSALPPSHDHYLMAINLFLAEQQLDAALAAWNRLLALKAAIRMEETIPLTDAFMSQDRLEEADKIWQQALEVTHWPQEKKEDRSLIFNGGFETVPANGGFDWREQRAAGASYALDTAVFHSGRQSMRVAFDGTSNLDFMHLQQYVPVRRAQSYQFSAYLRTETITTDSGLRFLIYDPFHPAKIQIVTPDLIGTNPWTPVHSEVTTAADTDLLVIVLRRIPSWKFDNKLRGTAWVDDVALVPVDKAPKAGGQ